MRVDNVGERVAGTTQRGGGDNASFLPMNNVETVRGEVGGTNMRGNLAKQCLQPKEDWAM